MVETASAAIRGFGVPMDVPRLDWWLGDGTRSRIGQGGQGFSHGYLRVIMYSCGNDMSVYMVVATE